MAEKTITEALDMLSKPDSYRGARVETKLRRRFRRLSMVTLCREIDRVPDGRVSLACLL